MNLLLAEAQTSVLVTIVIAIIAAIPPTLLAWGAMREAQNGNKKVDAVSDKADIVIDKAVEIHASTNSNLAKVVAELESAKKQIEGLTNLLTTMASKTTPPPVTPAKAKR